MSVYLPIRAPKVAVSALKPSPCTLPNVTTILKVRACLQMQRQSGNKWAMIAKMLTTEAEERVWHMRETGELLPNEIYPFRRYAIAFSEP